MKLKREKKLLHHAYRVSASSESPGKKRKGIIMPFTIIRQDITRMDTDAIVNAANRQLLPGGGVCGAIFKASGMIKLTAACRRLAPIETGQAVLTDGYKLTARYIIHTAGPVYDEKNPEESRRLLRSSYWNSLQLAKAHDLKSIAFPLISSGIYGYPKEEAMEVAVETIADFLDESDMQVYLTVFDDAAFLISGNLLQDVDAFISENYVHEQEQQFARRGEMNTAQPESVFLEGTLEVDHAPDLAPFTTAMPFNQELDFEISRMDEPFSQTLLRLIDAKGKTDVEVYKKANIDRKLFSKIRKGNGYTPRKSTILALCIALELSLEETDELLARAGYAFSHASKFDIIVEYFILHHRYNIFELNEVLFAYDQPQLG